ncbi:hypothetical protein AMECASPLE_026378 [Ameca splendens]|uniref:Uncharacterized protein n=1 Tax=Ameca splendens TaxID=208324 RepID=A0ABV0YGD2_9TELE
MIKNTCLEHSTGEMVQKVCCGLTSPHLRLFLEIMAIMSFNLKRKITIWIVNWLIGSHTNIQDEKCSQDSTRIFLDRLEVIKTSGDAMLYVWTTTGRFCL